jgi:hypothetical protein
MSLTGVSFRVAPGTGQAARVPCCSGGVSFYWLRTAALPGQVAEDPAYFGGAARYGSGSEIIGGQRRCGKVLNIFNRYILGILRHGARLSSADGCQKIFLIRKSWNTICLSCE